MALFPARDDWHAARHAAGLATDSHSDMHAGELETSILLLVARHRPAARAVFAMMRRSL
jgi:creatinine amidohydrolase